MTQRPDTAPFTAGLLTGLAVLELVLMACCLVYWVFGAKAPAFLVAGLILLVLAWMVRAGDLGPRKGLWIGIPVAVLGLTWPFPWTIYTESVLALDLAWAECEREQDCDCVEVLVPDGALGGEKDGLDTTEGLVFPQDNPLRDKLIPGETVTVRFGLTTARRLLGPDTLHAYNLIDIEGVPATLAWGADCRCPPAPAEEPAELAE